MKLSRTALALLPSLLLTLSITAASAQLLTDGNSQLPSCATNCPLLNQAAQACGGTQSADQQIWSCFCQSAYLTTLKTSPSGICDGVCTSSNDNQQLMTWYNTNCGSDYGASEHAGSQTGASASASTTSAATGTAAVQTRTDAAQPTTSTFSTAGAGSVGADDDDSYKGSWWHAHYKWVIMVIVLFIGLLAVALLAAWLKRRHDRKRDQIRGGFNEGITSRSAPRHPQQEKMRSGYAGGEAANNSSYLGNSGSQLVAGGLEARNGRNSPARTREAFMPYGYAYARSESRLGSRMDVDPSPVSGRKSPLARGGTPAGELEKGADEPAKRQRRVLVRERSLTGPVSPVEGR